ncbi:MAG TPA: NfeD family protein [Gemmataceae bacterium]|jgi:membrane-bound serine protease (ClpP class)|nr:NfeD family protein [Gemmataceae bacterium]
MDPLTIAYLLIVLGLALLVAELFIPTSGILFLVSSLCILGGVALTFVYGDTAVGMVTLLSVFVVVPAVATLMLYIWPRTPMGKRLILRDRDEATARLPVNLELEALRGRYGRALSDLRPAGTVDFDGRRVDTISEGLMVPAGSWVRCIDVRAGTVVVRQVDEPDLRGLESADFNS